MKRSADMLTLYILRMISNNTLAGGYRNRQGNVILSSSLARTRHSAFTFSNRMTSSIRRSRNARVSLQPRSGRPSHTSASSHRPRPT